MSHTGSSISELIETATRITRENQVEVLRKAQVALAERGDVHGYFDLAKIEAAIVDDLGQCWYEFRDGERCILKATREFNGEAYCSLHLERLLEVAEEYVAQQETKQAIKSQAIETVKDIQWVESRGEA